MAVADTPLNCKADAHELIRNRGEKLSALSGSGTTGPERDRLHRTGSLQKLRFSRPPLALFRAFRPSPGSLTDAQRLDNSCAAGAILAHIRI
jgi:hypothetical protein